MSREDTSPTEDSRGVGVGTSPDGRIALAIDGKGHIIELEDAKWIAQEIEKILGTDFEQTSSRDFALFVHRTDGVASRVERMLREEGIDSVDGIRAASMNDLTEIRGIGQTAAVNLKEGAEEVREDER